MDNVIRKYPLQRWKSGDDVTEGDHLNQPIDALIEAGIGVDIGTQAEGDAPELDIPPAYTKARLVATTTPAFSGLAAIDGVTPAEGDYILVSTGGAPARDGLWIASAGPWLQLVRLSYAQIDNPDAPVYPSGAVIAIAAGSAGPYAWRVTSTPSLQSLNSSGGSQQLIISVVAGDYLVCLPFSDAGQGTTQIFVAKPYLLRRSISSWNGMTFVYSSDQARTATLGASTESQVVVPAYVPNDVIYAVGNIIGGTRVSVAGAPVVWQDINADGRAWAKV